ncbi:MAG: hypothetical protein WC052_03700 [Patescibacteria group bacterium]|jgi:hypothetical protein
MIEDQFLKKRISETENDIFPLDRLLSVESVYLIFQREYAKEKNKEIFFKDRKFQRLREGYFAMFVAISLQDTSGKPHYLVFPSNPANDVYIAYQINVEKGEKPKFGAYEFDIKEYTNWSKNFEEFTENSVIPKIHVYNIAIPTYREMDGHDIDTLINYLQSENLANRTWILGLPTEADYSHSISAVTIISKEGIVYEKTIDLEDWVSNNRTPLVFQDVIRFK